MADNYLGKKFEDLASRKKTVRVRQINPSLDSLLLKNRSCRGWDSSVHITQEQLLKIVSVNTMIASAKNQQVLRFKLLTGEEAVSFNSNIQLGAALPELNLPFKGEEPSAFIIISSSIAENKWVYVDLGISVQSMLLKAVEMGLNGICIGAFNKAEAQKLVGKNMEPLMVLALGKGIEKYQILHVSKEEPLNYYRENGIHYIPKIKTEDLLIQ